VYHAERFRFVGGEPLLNPHILDYVKVVRESGISSFIEIATNGVLLDRASDELFESVDRISVSWYPDPRSHERIIESAGEKCRRHKTEFRVERISKFRTIQVAGPIDDQRVVNDIYQSCMIAHTWHCQTFYDGRFYLCSRPIFTAVYLQRLDVPAPDFHELDGELLHQPDLRERLIERLSSRQPLKACEYCLGTVGRYAPWTQLPAQSRRSPPQPLPLRRESISWKRMKFLLVWRKIESGLLKCFPSARLAKYLSVVLTGIIGD
ncbi:hypothetical protein MNBD_GAMMA16-1938, partial [hydrothermal vent metagenome]